MKRIRWLFPVFAIVAFAAAGWLLGHFSSEYIPAAPVHAQAIGGGIDVQELHGMNLDFVPVDPTAAASQVKISEQAAIATAQSQQGGRLKDATSVTAQLGYLSDLGLQAALNDPGLRTDGQTKVQVDSRMLGKQLVWVISFEGIETVASGPAGSKHGVANEFNSVIDATTGEFIIGFVYRQN